MRLNIASLSGLVVVGVAAGYAAAPAHGAETAPATEAKSIYLKERADCETGRTAEDRATCLKEAGAAQEERKRNRLDNAGSPRQNAIDRCNVVPAKDKADCLARIEGPNQPNQKTTTSGSVGGGGIIRETTTTTVGQPTIIMVPAAPAASAPP
jgi:hypothetical protein